MRITRRAGPRDALPDPVWLVDQRLQVLDSVVRILGDGPEPVGRLLSLLAPFGTTDKVARPAATWELIETEGTHRLFRHRMLLAEAPDPAELLAHAVASVNRYVIEEGCWFSVHAAVVAGTERVVAFPANSGDGKTTLTAACLLAGFDYLSDEALVLDDDGLVVPYPKPLALSPWSCAAVGLEPGGDERLVTADDLGATVRAERSALTDVVIASYGAREPRLERLPASQAIVALLEHAFNHYKDPGRAFRLATEAAGRVHVWRLDYDHPIEAAALLRDAVIE